MHPIVKVLISAVILVLASELAKRYMFAAVLTMALPLMSLLSLGWLAFSGEPRASLSAYALGIFWLVPPSLVFFPLFAWLVNRGVSLSTAFLVGIACTVVTYIVYIKILSLFGIRV